MTPEMVFFAFVHYALTHISLCVYASVMYNKHVTSMNNATLPLYFNK